jgi:hypothetical protein
MMLRNPLLRDSAELPILPALWPSLRAGRYAVLLLFLLLPAWGVAAGRANKATLVAQIPSSEEEVLAAVEEVAGDTIVHGTYSYEYERTLQGALPAASAAAFGDWKDKGTVYYKVAENVIAPRHFHETEAIGTISVRYVVTAADEKNTNLRIDAVYIESVRRAVHASDGAVETAEYEAIKARLAATRDRARAVEQAFAGVAREKSQAAAGRETTASSAASLVEQLEGRRAELRHQVEGRIKVPDAVLRSAPFRGASSLQALPLGTEVVILILTPYWYGVETADGHKGWLHRSQLEAP